MLKELLKNTRFKSIIERFYEKNKSEIVDILIFGSVVRGKIEANDLDLLLISLKKMDTDIIYVLRKDIEKMYKNISIKNITYSELFGESFKAKGAFISEGYSLINKNFISSAMGYTSFYLFKYKLKGFNKSERMRFYYSLYGRGGSKGMLKTLNAKKFSESVLLVPVEKTEEAKEYLGNIKVPYVEIPILIPRDIVDSKLI